MWPISTLKLNFLKWSYSTEKSVLFHTHANVGLSCISISSCCNCRLRVCGSRKKSRFLKSWLRNYQLANRAFNIRSITTSKSRYSRASDMLMQLQHTWTAITLTLPPYPHEMIPLTHLCCLITGRESVFTIGQWAAECRAQTHRASICWHQWWVSQI